MSRSLALALLLWAGALAGCASEDQVVEEVHKDFQTEPWMSEWDLLAREALRDLHTNTEVSELPFETEAIHRGKHLELIQLALAANATRERPFTNRVEAVIIVEGEGALLTGGETFALQPGTVVLLPPGVKERIVAGQRAPLLGLIVRATTTKSAAGGAAKVVPIEDYLTREVQTTKQPLLSRPIALAHDALSVEIVSVRGEIERHIHQEHDEVTFVLEGRGEFEVGSEGHRGAGSKERDLQRGYVTSKVRDKALLFTPARAPHGYENKSPRTLALVIYGPAPLGADRYPVPDRRPKAGDGEGEAEKR